MRPFLDWFFRDREGRIVIGQWPNLPLWLFGAAAALAWTVELWRPPGVPVWILPVLHAAARLFLAIWALDEIVRGVNPFRRCLGGLALIGLAASLLAGSL